MYRPGAGGLLRVAPSVVTNADGPAHQLAHPSLPLARANLMAGLLAVNFAPLAPESLLGCRIREEHHPAGHSKASQ